MASGKFRNILARGQCSTVISPLLNWPANRLSFAFSVCDSCGRPHYCHTSPLCEPSATFSSLNTTYTGNRSEAFKMMRKQLLRSISRSPAVVSNGSPVARTFATTARRQADVELTVDGKKVSVPGMEDTDDTD